ncbi:MAG: leucine-rich repeat protein [Spirochaetaceae bacterium]|jgi:hypothetical protein|nr:leucine-rich repeat protein [Spirochaetaceae bacterium]
MKKNTVCSGLIGIALVIGFVLAGCGTGPASPRSPDFDTEVAGYDVVITRRRGKGGDVIIPAIINGRSVIGIGEGAFYQCASLTSVTIPASVTSIGQNAFADCSRLRHADRNAILSRFGQGVFAWY